MKPLLFSTMTLWLCLLAAGAEPSVPAPPDPPPSTPGLSFIADGEFQLEKAVDHFQNLYLTDSSIAEATLTVTRPRQQRTMDLKVWTRGTEQALIVIQSPAREKGTATLKVGDNLWNYLPRIKRTIRIPPSMMLASWMGTDFTNDDLVREADYSEDYNYRLKGKAEHWPGWLIEFTAKPDTVGLWERIEVVVSPDGTLPLTARYYDRKGRLARRMFWTDFREFDGRHVAATMILIPRDQEGHRTEMHYRRLDFDAGVPESRFSLSRLEETR